MYYFLNRGGTISAVVNSGRYRPSPIPKGGLEISLSVTLKIDNENRRYLQRLIQLINDNYDPAVPVENNKSANVEEASDEMARGTGNEEMEDPVEDIFLIDDEDSDYEQDINETSANSNENDKVIILD